MPISRKYYMAVRTVDFLNQLTRAIIEELAPLPLSMPISWCNREADYAYFFFAFALLPHLPYEFVGARDGFAPATSTVEHSEPSGTVVELALSWMRFVSDAYCFLHTSGSSHLMRVSSV